MVNIAGPESNNADHGLKIQVFGKYNEGPESNIWLELMLEGQTRLQKV